MGSAVLVSIQNEMIAERLHCQRCDLLAQKDRQHLRAEGAKVCIHHVDRHLHRIKVKVVLFGHLKHAQVNQWILVSSKTDEAQLAL
jgi:ACT domain-containing protein